MEKSEVVNALKKAGVSVQDVISRRECGCGAGRSGCENCGLCEKCAESAHCLPVFRAAVSNEQRFSVGDSVVLSPDYRACSDACGGPMSPGDVGKVVQDDQSSKPYEVLFKGRKWWYEAAALRRAEAKTSVLQIGDPVMLSSHALQEGPLRDGKIGKFVQDDDSPRLPCRVYCNGTSHWYARASLVKAPRDDTLAAAVTESTAKVGLRVMRGPDWQWSNQDGGQGKRGTLVGNAGAGWWRVKWDAGGSNTYRVVGAHDLVKADD